MQRRWPESGGHLWTLICAPFQRYSTSAAHMQITFVIRQARRRGASAAARQLPRNTPGTISLRSARSFSSAAGMGGRIAEASASSALPRRIGRASVSGSARTSATDVIFAHSRVVARGRNPSSKALAIRVHVHAMSRYACRVRGRQGRALKEYACRRPRGPYVAWKEPIYSLLTNSQKSTPRVQPKSDDLRLRKKAFSSVRTFSPFHCASCS